MLNEGSHRSHPCPGTDTYYWDPRVFRDINGSFRDPNEDSITFQGDWLPRVINKTILYLGLVRTNRTCILLSVGPSGEFGNSPLQRKDGFLSGSSRVTVSP